MEAFSLALECTYIYLANYIAKGTINFTITICKLRKTKSSKENKWQHLRMYKVRPKHMQVTTTYI